MFEKLVEQFDKLESRRKATDPTAKQGVLTHDQTREGTAGGKEAPFSNDSQTSPAGTVASPDILQGSAAPLFSNRETRHPLHQESGAGG